MEINEVTVYFILIHFKDDKLNDSADQSKPVATNFQKLFKGLAYCRKE
jgi:hypothetical protein